MPSCAHDSLHFEQGSGTFYLACRHCGDRWAAVDGPADAPRHEALMQGFGVSPERQSPFYIKPNLQVHQVQSALQKLTVDQDLNVNLPEILTMLYLRPQAEVVSRFDTEVRSHFRGKPATKTNKDMLLKETRDFVRRIASSYVPR